MATLQSAASARCATVRTVQQKNRGVVSVTTPPYAQRCTSSHRALLHSRGRRSTVAHRTSVVTRASGKHLEEAFVGPAEAAWPSLILVRHGESLWNQRNLFTGCVDVPLTETGIMEALEAGKRIADIPVDKIFVSDLMRAQMTAMIAMSQHRRQKVPVVLHDGSEEEAERSKVFSEKTEVRAPERELVVADCAWLQGNAATILSWLRRHTAFHSLVNVAQSSGPLADRSKPLCGLDSSLYGSRSPLCNDLCRTLEFVHNNWTP